MLGEVRPWDGADGVRGCQVGGAGGRRARARHVAGALYLSRFVRFLSLVIQSAHRIKDFRPWRTNQLIQLLVN